MLHLLRLAPLAKQSCSVFPHQVAHRAAGWSAQTFGTAPSRKTNFATPSAPVVRKNASRPAGGTPVSTSPSTRLFSVSRAAATCGQGGQSRGA